MQLLYLDTDGEAVSERREPIAVPASSRNSAASISGCDGPTWKGGAGLAVTMDTSSVKFYPNTLYVYTYISVVH